MKIKILKEKDTWINLREALAQLLGWREERDEKPPPAVAFFVNYALKKINYALKNRPNSITATPALDDAPGTSVERMKPL